MNEFSESINTGGFEKALKKISNLDAVAMIKSFLSAYKGVSINIYFPNLENKQDEISFIIEGPNENFSLVDTAELMTKIQSLLQYGNIIIHIKRMINEDDFIRFYRDVTPLSNFNQVEKFLHKNYPELFALTLQAKTSEAYLSHGLLGPTNN